ncbi:MAG: hypothetical protein GY799_32575 [Desulfobulbaceae bacterium]|nr:hypothetical protein [Desulfobulbaceae bacterium]
MSKESKADKYLRERNSAQERVYELETNLQDQQAQHESAIVMLERTIRKLSVELKSVKDGVAQIMENVDEDGWAYEWCSKILK